MKGIFHNFFNQCAAGVKLTCVATIRSGRSRTAHLNRFMVKAAVRCEGAHQPTAENCVTVFSPGSGTDRSFFDRTTISASGKHSRSARTRNRDKAWMPPVAETYSGTQT